MIVGAFLFSVPCMGQLGPARSFSGDSLSRHVSGAGNALLECRFTYGRGGVAFQSSLDDNVSQLAKLDVFVGGTLNRPGVFIDRICLTGYSSIEGNYRINEELSRNRVQGFYRYLCDTYPQLSRYPCDLAWVAEDWSGLAALVRESRLDEREEILDIIHKVPGFDEREQLLVALNGGRVYRTMERTMFPGLRRVEMTIAYNSEPSGNALPVERATEKDQEQTTAKAEDGDGESFPDETVVVDNASLSDAYACLQTLPATNPSRAKHVRRPLFALKTNLLQWAGVQPDFSHTTLVGNVALEYFISSNWSVEAGVMYSYWHHNSGREFQGVSGYRLEPRYRFALVDNRIEMFLGAYGRFGDYDHKEIENGDTDNYTGNYWDAGVSAGLAFRLFSGFWIETGARAGYVHTTATKYDEEGRYNWYNSERTYHKMRVTDLNVSLVYRFRFR